MNPCSCVGINTTWACNWSCKHCFYRRNEKLHTGEHHSFEEIMTQAAEGKRRGCNRIVLIGEGEPTLHPDIKRIISEATAMGMHSNVITNGSASISLYQELFDRGLNHLQISAHCAGPGLNDIAERDWAWGRQYELMKWLKEQKLPFRANIAMQQLNYRELAATASTLVAFGAFHVALLGFLPHYEWKEHADEVAVHPLHLRPYMEKAAEVLERSGTYFTIRYHPMCCISQRWWKYVTNARYVLFDPWEWDYGCYEPSWARVWPKALNMGESVAILGAPCSQCKLREHCGGWNRHYAAAFAGAGLRAVESVQSWWDRKIAAPGGLHAENPANALAGYCVDGKPV